MFEVTFFDCGLEVGTFDYAAAPTIGTDYGDCVVVAVLEFDEEAMTASVQVEYF